VRRLVPALCVAAALSVASDAEAVEDRLHFGVDAGIATATFPEVTVAGFNGAFHGLYGISDAFNLRASFDVSVYELPDPDTSALMWGGLAGAEYVLDTIDWVVYGGIQAGPVLVSVQDGSDTWQAGVEAPIGLSYLLSERFALRIIEGRIRFQFFGDEASPLDQILITTGLELMLEP
jgi:hypothetical protein